jgi:hypothetical protein
MVGTFDLMSAHPLTKALQNGLVNRKPETFIFI